MISIYSFNKKVYSQETKFLLKRYIDYTEEYYVLKDNKKIKHGTYVKYREPGVSFSSNSISFGPSELHLMTTGKYENGLKSGLWEYYHEYNYSRFSTNSIKVRGNYINGMKNGVWTTYYLDTIPEIIQTEEYGKQNKSDSVNIKIIHNSEKLQSAGSYINDKRVGEWVSFEYTGEEYQRYNFTSGKLIKDKSLDDTTSLNKNRKALFIGGLPCLIDLLFNEIRLTDPLSKMKVDSISIVVSFLINKEGDVFQPEIFRTNAPKAFNNEAIRLVGLTKNSWIPSIQNGERTDTNYKLQFLIVRKSKTNISRIQIALQPIFD